MKKKESFNSKLVLITGAAGYIGSLLCHILLYNGYKIIAIDDLLFGGDSLLGCLNHPRFNFYKANITDKKKIEPFFKGVDSVVHLAGIVGFPACQQVGPQVAHLYNEQGTKNVFELAEKNEVDRFIFASTYSNYGYTKNGKSLNEDSPLTPQSLYAETKVKAEEYLLEKGKESKCCPIIFRFATLFGLSPRTRFDLIINQFVFEAIKKRKLLIYQKNYNRSFVHIRDIIKAILLGIKSEKQKVFNQIFNVGSNQGNYSKAEIIKLIQKYVKGVSVQYKDLTFGGDMRDIKVSFNKIRRVLKYKTEVKVEDGIKELVNGIESGFLYDPQSMRFRNAQLIVQ